MWNAGSASHSGFMSSRISSEGSGAAGHRAGEAAIPCQDFGGDLWFAERPEDVDVAKALCGVCPLREQCLAGALERREPWGVWGWAAAPRRCRDRVTSGAADVLGSNRLPRDTEDSTRARMRRAGLDELGLRWR